MYGCFAITGQLPNRLTSPNITQLRFWKIFPKLWSSPAAHRTCHANFRRPLRPRTLQPGSGAAVSAPRSTYTNHPVVDRPVRRSYPEFIQELHEPRRSLHPAPPREIATPGRVLHALPSGPVGERSTRQPVEL